MPKKIFLDKKIITSWCFYFINAIRILGFMPFIIKYFDDVEVATWYLYSSYCIIGDIFMQRVGVTFTRMITFVRGGKKTLKPITGEVVCNASNRINWTKYKNIKDTLIYILKISSFTNLFICITVATFSLYNILQGYSNYVEIILSSIIFIVFNFTHHKYFYNEILLRGMGYVNMINILGIISAFISTIMCIYILEGGCSFLLFTSFFHLFYIIKIILLSFALFSINSKIKDKCHTSRKKIIVIFKNSWSPTWKGFLCQLGHNGVLNASVLIYSLYKQPLFVAPFAFTISILTNLLNFSSSSFTAVEPSLTKHRVRNENKFLFESLHNSIQLVLIVFIICLVAFICIFPFLATLLNINKELLSDDCVLILGIFIIAQKSYQFLLTYSALGNNMLAYKQHGITFVITSVLLLVTGPFIGLKLHIIISFIPYLGIVGIFLLTNKTVRSQPFLFSTVRILLLFNFSFILLSVLLILLK